MKPEFLLDTHIAVRWLAQPQRLSKDQLRLIRAEIARARPLGLAAITLLEMATLLTDRGRGLKVAPGDLLLQLEASPNFVVLPITFEIAAELASVGRHLRDPADRAIVATARVHRLKLITSDERIINSKLVPRLA